MTILLSSAFVVLLASCALMDARTYRIPDALTSLLFMGAIGATFVPGWHVMPRDALYGFLFIFPMVFLMWSGSPLPVSSVPTGPDGLPPASGAEDDEPWSLRDLLQFVLPSAVTWLIVLVAGALLLDPLLWAALPMGLLCGAGAFAKGWQRAPWAGTRMSSSWLGGGDMKMLGGCLMLVGISGAQPFSFSLAILNLVLIACLRLVRRGRDAAAWETRRIPMGVAIGGAAFTVLLQNVVLAI